MPAHDYRLGLKAQLRSNGVTYPIDVTTGELERLAFGLTKRAPRKPKAEQPA